MNNEIMVAIIALVGTAIGTGGGILASSKLTVYRIEQLEKKMDKHNTLIERMYEAEEKICLMERDLQSLKGR